jgi:hypothetical protein
MRRRDREAEIGKGVVGLRRILGRLWEEGYTHRGEALAVTAPRGVELNKRGLGTTDVLIKVGGVEDQHVRSPVGNKNRGAETSKHTR